LSPRGIRLGGSFSSLVLSGLSKDTVGSFLALFVSINLYMDFYHSGVGCQEDFSTMAKIREILLSKGAGGFQKKTRIGGNYTIPEIEA